jgi:hypothetical protein
MKVLPPDVPTYTVKQAGSPGVPQLTGGGARVIIVAPSNIGKTVICCNLLTRSEAWRGCFERIYVFSPSVNLDRNWDVVKRYQANSLKAGVQEKLYYPEWSEEALQNIIDRQAHITQIQKDRGMRRLYSICICIDDVADRADIARNSHALQTLFVRGRHFCITTVVCVQKFRVLNNLIRINCSDLLCGYIRSNADLDAIAEETSAVLPEGKKGFLKLYHFSTQERHSFLNCKLADPDRENTFWLRFDHPIHLEEEEERANG